MCTRKELDFFFPFIHPFMILRGLRTIEHRKIEPDCLTAAARKKNNNTLTHLRQVFSSLHLNLPRKSKKIKHGTYGTPNTIRYFHPISPAQRECPFNQ
jgi:hypothetical protein